MYSSISKYLGPGATVVVSPEEVRIVVGHQRFGMAGVIVAIGLGIDFTSVAAFLTKRTTVRPEKPAEASHLVTDGLYRFTRNPMYLGLTLVMIGAGIWFGNWLGVVPIGFFVWYLTVKQIRAEEEALAEKFGEEYEAYRAKVRRWI